jgi:hypothetical protein
MPSLTAKDRAPLCLFSYEDGRHCRTPRIASHPHFCFYHAQKESQSQSAEKLANDLAYFFSGDYLTANDLNTAMARLIPAVIRGQIKPRLARTVAYMLQTLFQSLRLAQHEYINAFGTDGWRQAIASSVNNNQDYRFPAAPNAPEPSTESASTPTPTQAAQPSPNTPIGAGLARPAPAQTSPRPTQPPPQPEPPTAAAPTTNPVTPPQTTQPAAPTPPQPPTPRRQPAAPNRNPYHYDHTYRLYVDGKPWDGKPR